MQIFILKHDRVLKPTFFGKKQEIYNPLDISYV
ncbi:hypothetical protein M085_4996, partial [Bacteroides fragilis str. 3986 N(B)19]